MTSSKWPIFYFDYQLNIFTAPEAMHELSCNQSWVPLIHFLKGSCIKKINSDHRKKTPQKTFPSTSRKTNVLLHCNLYVRSISATNQSDLGIPHPFACPFWFINLVTWKIYESSGLFSQSQTVSCRDWDQ